MSLDVNYKRLYGFEFKLKDLCNLDVLTNLMAHAPKIKDNHAELWNMLNKQRFNSDKIGFDELKQFPELSELFYENIDMEDSDPDDRDLAAEFLCEIMSEISDIPLDWMNEEPSIWLGETCNEMLEFMVGIPQCYLWNPPEGLKGLTGLSESDVNNRLMRIIAALPENKRLHIKKPDDCYLAFLT